MEITALIDNPQALTELPKREVRRFARAATEGVGEAAVAVKRAWGVQVESVLSARLANTFKHKVYPQGGRVSLNAAAMVVTKADEIVYAHEEGVTIRARNARWIAIPTPAAGKAPRGNRLTPAEWSQQKGVDLKFIPRKGKPSLLVAEGRLGGGKNYGGMFRRSRSKTGRGLTTIPIFILVPQVRLPKRLNLKSAAMVQGHTLPSRIVAAAQRLAQSK